MFETIQMALVIIVIGTIAALMIAPLFSSDDDDSVMDSSSQLIHIVPDTRIEGFDTLSYQEKFEIIEALKDGTARIGLTNLGPMNFDISTGRKIR